MKTYWNNDRNPELVAVVTGRVPNEGPCDASTPALEAWRNFCNCYHQLHNNGYDGAEGCFDDYEDGEDAGFFGDDDESDWHRIFDAQWRNALASAGLEYAKFNPRDVGEHILAQGPFEELEALGDKLLIAAIVEAFSL